MKRKCLNTGCVHHRAQFSWDSLYVALNTTEVRKFGAPIPVVCHSGSRPCRVSGGGFPIGKLTFVDDQSVLSSNFMWWTGAAITSPLLVKRTDVYN